MNSNERFGQIESLLVDVLRRLDQLTERMDRQAGQIDQIIDILKLSDKRQTQAEERQDLALAEIKAQGQRLDKQGQQIDKQGQQIDKQGQRLEEHSQYIKAMLTAQTQMLDLLTRTNTKADSLVGQVPTVIAFESRIERLENAVFNKAS
jgi:chromosome segregation ATPase